MLREYQPELQVTESFDMEIVVEEVVRPMIDLCVKNKK